MPQMEDTHCLKKAIDTLANKLLQQENQINQLRTKLRALEADTERRTSAAAEEIRRAKELLVIEVEMESTLRGEIDEIQSNLRQALTDAKNKGRKYASTISYYANECSRLKNNMLDIAEEGKSKWGMWKWLHPYGTIFAMAATLAYATRAH